MKAITKLFLKRCRDRGFKYSAFNHHVKDTHKEAGEIINKLGEIF